MKHGHWVKLIHLHRKNEITQHEQDALKRHLRSCAHCRELAEARGADWDILLRSLQEEPIFTGESALTSSIFTGISTNRSPKAIRRPDLTAIVFGRPSQVGFQLVSLVLLAIFLFEQAQLTYSLQALERELQDKSGSYTTARLVLLPGPLRAKLTQELELEFAQGQELWSHTKLSASALKDLSQQSLFRQALGAWSRDSIPGLKKRLSRLNQDGRRS